ncbi:ergothioneine biosynthesis protein EgtB [Crocinitomix catalasitica]|uniref:ergothioneine biosynthesis protein EgtB n=1 Tax=Crocinitomix catalasitica TaxID=184607 RepID=UPI000561397E|nr:ergothioneine biosynthesis protein EgtB [Crocinitomix catalasitica]
MINKIREHFTATRKRTEELCKPLAIEDYSAQPIIDVSPPKWHLAHSTWFFEQFILVENVVNYKVFNADYAFFFNSYYNNVGERVLRPNRGLMTRPLVAEVYDYRRYVTEAVNLFLADDNNCTSEILALLELGINHEEQHQELLAYDIKYILGHQPLFPNHKNDMVFKPIEDSPEFLKIEEGLYTIGHQNDGFCFDNELGVHKVYLHEFEIAKNLVTNRDYIEFIEAGGYDDFNLWHAEGWDFIQNENIKSPLYWHFTEGKWHSYHYNGLELVDPNLPVVNISFYEAAAYAAWKGKRLPTEFEWEIASGKINWGQLWEWTGSAYLPYPGFEKAPGALGEYNGKFMVNQHVLRGGSIATANGHTRITYRNFFHPNMRWQFSGIRLAK